MSKLLSGRFIFTVITAVVFAHMAMTGKINGEQALAIVTMVIAFYFSRTDRTPTEGGQK